MCVCRMPRLAFCNAFAFAMGVAWMHCGDALRWNDYEMDDNDNNDD